MKSYIRAILNDLNLTAKKQKPQPPLPEDLDNQTLSNDPAQRVRQLDWQAQKSEERQTLG
jgi:hypothetical protein